MITNRDKYYTHLAAENEKDEVFLARLACYLQSHITRDDSDLNKLQMTVGNVQQLVLFSMDSRHDAKEEWYKIGYQEGFEAAEARFKTEKENINGQRKVSKKSKSSNRDASKRKTNSK